MAKKSAPKLIAGADGFANSGCDAARGAGFFSIAAGLIGEICFGLGGVVFFTVVILVDAILDMMTVSKSSPKPSSATTILLTGVLSIKGSAERSGSTAFFAVTFSGFAGIGGVFSFGNVLLIFDTRGAFSS